MGKVDELKVKIDYAKSYGGIPCVELVQIEKKKWKKWMMKMITINQ